MKIAVAQTTTGIDSRASAAKLAASIERAGAEGATMLFTPEMSGLLDRDRARAASSIVAEDEDVVLRTVREAAARRGLWVALGSLAVRLPSGRNANRSFVIDASGTVRARYDKLHMFDVELGSESWRESAAYQSGERAVAVETPVGTLGLSVCYDLRFPALYQALSAAGASVLAVPAAFTVPTGRAHWHTLLRARAIENASFVVAAAQVGTHADGRATYGHSLVIDPWGEVVLDLGEEAGLGFAELDPSRIEETRRRVPVLAHRRAIPPVERA